MPESFCRTLGMHCYCSYSVNSESSVSFLRQNFSHMPTVRLARCSQPLPVVRSSTHALGAFLASVAPWPACAGVSCGGRSTVAADRKQNGGTTPLGAAQMSWWLRVATSLPAHACSTVAMARHAPSALPAADGPAPPRSAELTPKHHIPARLAPKWDRWTSTTKPKPLIPLHIPGTAVITHQRSPFTASALGRL